MILFRIPLRVEPSFLLITAMVSLTFGAGLPGVVAWVVAVFVSVVVHELGHALVARAYGYAPWIVLHGMGGTTFRQASIRRTTVWNEMAISLAGPGAGFLLGGLVLGAIGLSPVALSQGIVMLANDILFFSFFWGAVNLLPILPLDGGHVTQQLCIRFFPGAPRLPYIITAVAGTLSACLAIVLNWFFWAVLSGLWVFRAIQAIREIGPSPLTYTRPVRRATGGAVVPIVPRQAPPAEDTALVPPEGQGAANDPDPMRAARSAFIREPSEVNGAALAAIFAGSRRFSALAAVASGPDGKVIGGVSLVEAARLAFDAGVVRGAIELGELAFARGGGVAAGEIVARAFGRLGESDGAALWIERTSQAPEANMGALREVPELAALRDDPRWAHWTLRPEAI